MMLEAQAPRPPFAGMVAPVIHRASSDARKATTSAMSSGRLSLPRAAIWAYRRLSSSVLPCPNSSVSVGPGETTLTVIPLGPSSIARTCESCSTAPLVAT